MSLVDLHHFDALHVKPITLVNEFDLGLTDSSFDVWPAVNFVYVTVADPGFPEGGFQ